MPPNTDLPPCLLSPGPTVLRRRILERGWSQADTDEAVAEDALLADAQFVDLPIETAALPVAATIARLREYAHFDDQAREIRTEQVTSASGVAVLVLTGPRAAGSSTVGFELARRQWRAGRKTGFLDLRQLGDDLLGADREHQAAAAAAALAEQHILDSSAVDDLVLDISGRTPDEAVAHLKRLTSTSHEPRGGY